jgi:hypothetical protein
MFRKVILKISLTTSKFIYLIIMTITFMIFNISMSIDISRVPGIGQYWFRHVQHRRTGCILPSCNFRINRYFSIMTSIWFDGATVTYSTHANPHPHPLLDELTELDENFVVILICNRGGEIKTSNARPATRLALSRKVLFPGSQ